MLLQKGVVMRIHENEESFPLALDVSRKKLEASLYKRSLETSEGRKVPPLLRSEVLPSYKILTIRFPGNPS